MSRSLPIPPPGFDELPTEEKVRYVATLWDRIATAPDQIPVPDWHRRLLRDRLAEHRKDPDAKRSWREELLQELAGSKHTPR